MKIELLYFDDCPSHERLQPRLERLLREAGVAVPVELRRIESPEAAEAARFLGSPTLRINGEDVEPAADERADYGLKCRLYRSADGASGLPPDDWIRAVLGRAKPQEVELATLAALGLGVALVATVAAPAVLGRLSPTESLRET